MKHLILLMSFVTLTAIAQDKLSEAEKQIVEEARNFVKVTKEPKPSRLQERMQSEFGDMDEDPLQNCRYDLVGSDEVTKSNLEPKKIKFETCLERAKKALKDNSKVYNRVLVKHGNHSIWKVIELEDLK